jgi:hypothetical protein
MSYGFNEIENSDNKLRANRTATATKLAEAQADKSLHPDFKSAKLREIQNAGDAIHERLLSERKQAVGEVHGRLYTAAFQRGIWNTDAYRTLYTQADAAAGVGASELARLRQQAANTTDSLLAAAVTQVAWDRDMLSLLPQDNPAVNELLEFEYKHSLRRAVVGADRTRQLSERMRESMRTTAPNRADGR